MILQSISTGRLKYRTVFVITHGRSGSTLLQSILNNIPGYLIRGENGNALYHIFRHYVLLKDAHEQLSGLGRTSRDPWYGIDLIDPDEYIRKIIDLFVADVILPEADTRVIGFKEIRYHLLEENDLYLYLDFLIKFFPSVQFVFNMRNVLDTSRSGWFKGDPGAPDRITKAHSVLTRCCDRYEDISYMVKYDEYVNSIDKLSGLFSFLGEKLDADSVRRVMKIRHSVYEHPGTEA